MSALRLMSCLSLAMLLAGASGDRAPRAGPAPRPGLVPPNPASGDRGAAARGVPGLIEANLRPGTPLAAAPSMPAVLREFALFGWVSPPVDSTSVARMTELGGIALNLALPAWDDSGRLADNRQRMAFAATRGVRCLAWDRRLVGVDFSRPSDGATLDSVVADYRYDPGFLGYYFTDEPAPAEFPLLARFYAELAARDPDHPCFDNLLGRAAFASRAEWETYTRAFLDQVRPSVLCNDQYDFLLGGDRGQFVENVAGLRALASEYGVPFWAIVQLIQHGGYRALTPGELRWQVSMLLAYGARGVGYFTYWTPAPNPNFNWQPAVIGWDGVRSPWYGVLQGFNPYVRAAGETLARLTWLSTRHAGSVPQGGAAFAFDGWIVGVEGRAALGSFRSGNESRFVLVANADSSSSQSITLSLVPRLRVWKLGPAPDSWSELPTEYGGPLQRLMLDLEAGDFVLLRLDRGPLGPTVGSEIGVTPNPARGEVRFWLDWFAPGARLEILDAAGRRVWSHVLGDREATLAWRGERDRGGLAPPGLYTVRVTDARGTALTRVSWLGRR